MLYSTPFLPSYLAYNHFTLPNHRHASLPTPATIWSMEWGGDRNLLKLEGGGTAWLCCRGGGAGRAGAGGKALTRRPLWAASCSSGLPAPPPLQQRHGRSAPVPPPPHLSKFRVPPVAYKFGGFFFELLATDDHHFREHSRVGRLLSLLRSKQFGNGNAVAMRP